MATSWPCLKFRIDSGDAVLASRFDSAKCLHMSKTTQNQMIEVCGHTSDILMNF